MDKGFITKVVTLEKSEHSVHSWCFLQKEEKEWDVSIEFTSLDELNLYFPTKNGY